MINTTGHFLRFNMGEEEDTSLPKIVSVDASSLKPYMEEIFQSIKKGASVSISPEDYTSLAMDLIYILQGNEVTPVGEYNVFVPEIGVVTINITENPPINPTEINLKITNITKTEENPILYNSDLECYYMVETINDEIFMLVLYYKLYSRTDNYREIYLNGYYNISVWLVPLFNNFYDVASISFDFRTQTLFEILSNIPIVGRFIAAIDDVAIELPNSVDFSSENPPILRGHRYEYNIYQGVFNLMDVTPE